MVRKLQHFFDPPPAILASKVRARIQELREENENDIQYDEDMEEYVATALAGAEVFGQTRQECYDNLREVNRVWLEHCRKYPEDRDEL